MNMKKYKLLLAYDGTHYVGWQIQPNGNSIQHILQETLSILLKENCIVIGAGRTDAGVHAIGQVAHFQTSYTGALLPLLKSLNGMLPHDIRVKLLEEVEDSFHARFSAKSKEYHYHLWLGDTIDPFFRLYRHHMRHSIDITLLRTALSRFVGRHDFRTFANVNTQIQSTIRTLYRIDLIEQEGGYRIEYEGEGFLYKMVRNITGTVLDIARGKRSLSELDSLFSAKDRRAIGIAAPAKGLFLQKVRY
jgi:tRNA pseudouridine38-40 synthase